MRSAERSCPRSILLIEDDVPIREMVSQFLEERGYPVEGTSVESDALDLLARIERPCLVLLDLLTMRFNPKKLLAILHRDDRVATLPIVIVPVRAPELFSKPVPIKRPLHLDILARIVDAHCCRGGGLDDFNPGARLAPG